MGTQSLGLNCPLSEVGTPPPHNSGMAYGLETEYNNTYMNNSVHNNHPQKSCELARKNLEALLRNLKMRSTITALWLSLDTIHHGTNRSLDIVVINTLEDIKLYTTTI